MLTALKLPEDIKGFCIENFGEFQLKWTPCSSFNKGKNKSPLVAWQLDKLTDGNLDSWEAVLLNNRTV